MNWALLKLMRLYYTLPFAIGFVVIVLYLRDGNIAAVSSSLALGVAALFFTIGGGYVLNSICDIRADIVNCPVRVLTLEKAGKINASIFSIILFIAAMVCGAFVSWRFCTGIVLISLGLIFYDLFSKRIGFFKDILVALLMISLYPLAFLFSEPVDGPRLNVLFIHPAWLFFTAMGYEMLKDIVDIRGDERISRYSVAIWSKAPWFNIMARVFIMIGGILALLPSLLWYCQWIYLVAAIIAATIAALSCRVRPQIAIRFIYLEVVLVTLGALLDIIITYRAGV